MFSDGGAYAELLTKIGRSREQDTRVITHELVIIK